MRKRVIVVGATGSIGRQTLDVVDTRPDLFEVVGLSAHSDETGLEAAAARYPGAALCLSGAAPSSAGISLFGPTGLDELVGGVEADIVVNGASGSGGLRPSLAALASGKSLALANKESIVMAWPLLETESAAHGAKIIPVDSEHAALFQLLSRLGEAGAAPARGGSRESLGQGEVEELVITASGGAFRDKSLADLKKATPNEAAAHPNWNMGRKITIDSATMANKGLEVIEASRLFGFPSTRVRVLIHPQSIVHALVRTRDGSLYAQLSSPDMRLPIQNALAWPDSLPCPFGKLDLAGRSFEFREPEGGRYPLLGLAYEALAGGEGATIAYNAADEVGGCRLRGGPRGLHGYRARGSANSREPVAFTRPRSGEYIRDRRSRAGKGGCRRQGDRMVILTIILGLIGLGIVVIIHELGHFFAARAMGVEVEAFSVGWGPRIAGFVRKGTEWRFSAFPIGGYCKMKGEESFRKALEEKASELPREKGSYYGAAPWRRIVIALSGPLANVLLAFVIFVAVSTISYSTPTFPNRIVLLSEYRPRLSALAELPGGQSRTEIRGPHNLGRRAKDRGFQRPSREDHPIRQQANSARD